MGKIGHTIVGVLSVISIVFCACALTDGRSIATIRTDEKAVVVNLNGVSTDLVIQQLPGIGYPYGIGVYSDSNGRKWDQGDDYAELVVDTTNQIARRPSHFTQLFGCDEHQKRGQLLLACVFMCLIASIVSVIASLRGVATQGRVAGIVSMVFQIFNFVFFLIGMAAGASFYDEEFECKSENTIMFDLKVADYFDLSYALPFVVVGVITSIINIIILCASGSLKDSKKGDNCPDDSSSS
eukprot:TRINITY_DN3671_c0_g1_i1.p1 TRINITY_DN3671_c0_g1~~TRINITY_DN3671_c0_g1_i1.p1  ORF type:complete len:239 (+),score=60.93 TRINITY_DN3671_c0_g1_i1:90-806(+)